MKTIPSQMATHLDSEVTTLAWCWKATRRDGLTFGFTAHDTDLLIDGVTYYAETGLNASNAQAKIGANVDNLEVAGMLDSATITEADIRAGLWDGCEIKVFIVNWKDLTSQLIVQTGTIGDITMKKLSFIAEMRSLSQFLQNTIGRIMTRRCDADFTDTRCGLLKANYTSSSSVLSVNTITNFTATSNLLNVNTEAILANGLIVWTSGLNTGTSMEVKTITTDTIVELRLPMSRAIQIGDTFDITSGCDKNFTTCTAYGNAVNFRGFPHIPGLDAVMAYP